MKTANISETTNFLQEFPTSSQVESFIKRANEIFEQHRKNSQYRMENYFNCVDDYSWGGICDKAQSEHSSALKQNIQNLQEQLELGKPFVQEFTVDILTDLEGNIVSERVVDGKYGQCWLIEKSGNISFCGTAKKQATYNKKGYKLMERVYEVEYYFTTKEYKNDLITKGRVLNSSIREVKGDIEGYCNTRLNSIAYFALNN